MILVGNKNYHFFVVFVSEKENGKWFADILHTIVDYLQDVTAQNRRIEKKQTTKDKTVKVG